MKSTLYKCLMFFVIATACWFLYGSGRTFVETFGLSAKGITAGLMLCWLFTLPFVLMIATVMLKKEIAGLAQLALIYFSACVLGALVAETQILADEVAFAKEAVQSQDGRHSRARQWPHEGAGLVFAQERGFWSTD